MTPPAETPTHRGLAATRKGLVLAEGLMSGCLWSVVMASAAVGGLVTAWVLPSAAPWSTGLLLVAGVVGLALLARQRRRKTERVLAERPGTRRFPTLWHPIAVPMSVWTHDGITRIWRVHGVTPTGRTATAEVMVEVPTGVSFVAWSADRPRPPAARDVPPLPDPVLPGRLMASRRPEAVAPAVRRALPLLEQVVPDDGHVAVYPFGMWWRVTGPVDAARLQQAEEHLVALAEALRG